MSLLKWCDEGPATVSLQATVEDAINTMLEKQVGAVAVIDEQGVVAGMFTERDVLAKFALSGRDPKTHAGARADEPHGRNGNRGNHAPARRFRSCWNGTTATCRSWTITGKCWASVSIRNILEARVDDLLAELDANHSARAKA